jgi:hypothetical protein
MRRGTPVESRLVAYHEAGHAVAAFVLKRPMAPLALQVADSDAGPDRSEGEPAGYAGTVPIDAEHAELAERDTVILLAGAEAEALLTADCDWYAAAGDWERAEELIARALAAGHRIEPRGEQEAELVSALGADPRLRAWELVRARAHTLVHEPPVRSAIAAVAAALLEAGALDVQQTQRAIRQGIAAADPELTDPT